VFEFKLMKEKEDHQKEDTAKGEVNLKRFISILLPLGFLGWLLEALITSWIARYIRRLRPDLLRLGGEPS
jgi:ABC-type Co2+ transport system permease subunit